VFVASLVDASCLDVAFPTAGIGTELLADREKIEMTRNGSPFERSPVPMASAHPRHTRAVCAIARRRTQT
jgi:hypothetical protein